MRSTDEELPPEAVARIKQERIRFWAGLALAAAGLAAVFLLDEPWLGFGVALVGTGIVPFDKMAAFFKR